MKFKMDRFGIKMSLCNIHFSITNNWKYKGWNKAKFLFWQGVNIFGQRFLIIILFGIVFGFTL